MASIFTLKDVKGKNCAIVTHAGGPAVMLADALSKGRLNVPSLEGPIADELKSKLYPGAAVGNPIDIIGTGHRNIWLQPSISVRIVSIMWI